MTSKIKNKYLSEYRLCSNIWSLFENSRANFNKNYMLSEHMQCYKHKVATLPIFETGPFWGVRDPTPLTKHDEKMSKNQFTGTATQPQCNRNATAIFVSLIRTSTVIYRRSSIYRTRICRTHAKSC